MSFESLLNQTCTIQTQTQTQKGTGDIELSYATGSANVPCRIVKNSNTGKDLLSGKVRIGEFTIYIKATYSITEKDRILVGTETYDIILATKDSSNHHWELQCNKIIQ